MTYHENILIGNLVVTIYALANYSSYLQLDSRAQCHIRSTLCYLSCDKQWHTNG